MIFMCKLLSTLFLHCKLSLQTPNVCILVWGDNISLVLLEGRIDELQYGFFGGVGGGDLYTVERNHCLSAVKPTLGSLSSY